LASTTRPRRARTSSAGARCEYEGAYPAADSASGGLYVGYEFNWTTDTPFSLDTPCLGKRAQNIVARVPRRCLALRAVSPCAGPAARAAAPPWDHQSYDFPPDFGDYTDNVLTTTGSKPYVGHTLYIAWTDGRTGVPQPYEAHLLAGG
jgi:hypothetical protein